VVAGRQESKVAGARAARRWRERQVAMLAGYAAAEALAFRARNFSSRSMGREQSLRFCLIRLRGGR